MRAANSVSLFLGMTVWTLLAFGYIIGPMIDGYDAITPLASIIVSLIFGAAALICFAFWRTDEVHEDDDWEFASRWRKFFMFVVTPWGLAVTAALSVTVVAIPIAIWAFSQFRRA